MNIWQGIFLGIVQGAAEFLPVSSSGHLVLFSQILKVEPNLFFNVLLHLATLLAVVTVFWKDIIELIKKPFCDYNIKLLITTGITIVIILIIKSVFDIMPTGIFLSVYFLITATMLFVMQRMQMGEKISPPTYKSSIFCGIFQGIAGIAGISRSASTVFAQVSTGVDAKSAARFSFLASIPIIIASMAYSLVFEKNTGFELLPTLAAFIAAYIVGVFALKLVYKIFEKRKYTAIIVYLVIIAIISAFL